MSEAVERLNAALEGRYRIEREIGEGGMATVYLADDLRHERKVALKVLKPELAAVVGADRFLAEIKTTANLQHPNILPLHDSGQADSFLFYVMPYVAGESLRERLDREHQLPVDEAVQIAKDVAGALDYAHRQGVIHRDIKPANVLMLDGKPVVSDFGIALAVGAAGGGRLTETGLSLGTPHYMSPEQATGDAHVGPATDVYALGCVLYEMLAGDPPHIASTPQAILGKIITEPPPQVTKARKSVPRHVEAAIAKALEKLPADRFRNAAEFGRSLAASLRGPPQSGGREQVSTRAWKWIAAGSTTVALASVLGVVWALSSTPVEVANPSLRIDFSEIEVRATDGTGVRVAISTDGSKLAFSSVGTGVTVRHADRSDLIEIGDADGAREITFSPDGEWIAFLRGSMMMRVRASGGAIYAIAEGGAPHWFSQDTILFSRQNEFFTVNPMGGEPRSILQTPYGRAGAPHVLPDGDAFLFQIGTGEEGALAVADRSSGEISELGLFGSDPVYAHTGHLLYGDQETQSLMAVRFDARSRQVVGQPVPVRGVQVYVSGATQFSVSEAGTAVYGLPQADGGALRRLSVVGMDGRSMPSPLAVAGLRHPQYSPDGEHVTYDAGGDIWVYNTLTGSNQAVITDRDNDYPAWSSDGRHIYFTRDHGATGREGAYRLNADPPHVLEEVFDGPGREFPLSVMEGGGQILMLESGPDGLDLVIWDPDVGGLSEFLGADWNEAMGTISPSGAWIAYVSDESGSPEVYVRSYPGARFQTQVSDGGGTEPLWAPDQSAIYYRDGDRVIRAGFTDGPMPELGPRTELFSGPWVQSASMRQSTIAPMTNWDVHPDGRSFLMVEAEPGESVPRLPIEITTNFFAELERLLPD